MINLGISIFDLAYQQVLKEKRNGKNFKNIKLVTIDRAIRIRQYLDDIERTKKSALTRQRLANAL